MTERRGESIEAHLERALDWLRRHHRPSELRYRLTEGERLPLLDVGSTPTRNLWSLVVRCGKARGVLGPDGSTTIVVHSAKMKKVCGGGSRRDAALRCLTDMGLISVAIAARRNIRATTYAIHHPIEVGGDWYSVDVREGSGEDVIAARALTAEQREELGRAAEQRKHDYQLALQHRSRRGAIPLQGHASSRPVSEDGAVPVPRMYSPDE